MTRHEHAIALAKLGLRLFPLRPGTKRPWKSGWQLSANAHPALASELWGGRFKEHNIGVATGQGVLVLDFDVTEGKRGLESLEMLDMLGLPETLRVHTPSGGVHVYLSAPKDFPFTISAGKLPGFPDVDVRGEGGYVVGPGSALPAGEYTIIK